MKIPILNPIVLAGLHGILGGLVVAKGPQRRRSGYQSFGAPVIEEVLFRGVPGALGVPGGVSTAAFAGAHAVDDPEHTDPVRLGDVVLGSLIYQAAFKQFGIVGAIGAHVAHNLAVGLGQSLVRRKKR